MAETEGEIESLSKDNPYAAQRQRAEDIRSQRKIRSKPIKKSDIDTSWKTRPEPGSQPPQNSWNQEIVRPVDKAGNDRIVPVPNSPTSKPR